MMRMLAAFFISLVSLSAARTLASANPGAPGTAPAAPPAADKTNAPKETATLIKPLDNSKPSSLLSGIIEDYTYSAEGKRDPFLPYEEARSSSTPVGPIFPLQRFDLDQLKLVGVIWEVKQPKAMIIDPSGKGYIVKVNEKIGRNNGYVARIREGEVVVVEIFTTNDGKVNYQTKFLRMAND